MRVAASSGPPSSLFLLNTCTRNASPSSSFYTCWTVVRGPRLFLLALVPSCSFLVHLVVPQCACVVHRNIVLLLLFTWVSLTFTLRLVCVLHLLALFHVFVDSPPCMILHHVHCAPHLQSTTFHHVTLFQILSFEGHVHVISAAHHSASHVLLKFFHRSSGRSGL